MSDTTRILFLGNSYTAANNLPGMVELLFAAGGHERPVHCAMITPGGWTLEQHWNSFHTRDTLVQGKWSFVVLQDMSLQSIMNPDAMDQFGRLLDKEVRLLGAKTVFFMTWARGHFPEMQALVSRSYRGLAEACGAMLAPVGEAWAQSIARRGEVALHAADRTHPTEAGSYLAACVFYAVISGKSPVGLPGQLSARDEKGDPIKLADLDAQTAAFFQQVAWETVAGRQP